MNNNNNNRLEDYIQKYDGGLITTIKNDTDNTMDHRMTITWKQKWEDKQLCGRFKQPLKRQNLDMAKKKKLSEKKVSLLIAAPNNAIRTNHIKARIDQTHQNSKCRLCGDQDETINHMISECSKSAQKEYKTRHDWVGKVIH